MPRSSAGTYESALREGGVTGVLVVHAKVTGSTNVDARRLLETGEITRATIVVADEQTAGRGRSGRSWLSPRGSLAMTLALPDVPLDALAVLPLLAGVAVADALARSGAPPALLKWPNDVTIGGLKAAGILCESVVGSGRARALVGIGVNVASPPAAQRLATATWVEATRGRMRRERLAAAIVRGILDRLRASPGAAGVVGEWKARALPWWGRRVRLIDHTDADGPRTIDAVLEDVDVQGRLVIRDDRGTLRSLTSAEISELRDAPTNRPSNGGDPEVRYFRDVEAAFVSRRGDPLFISNADWVRIRRWRERGIPLRILLRGIEDAFDAHAHSFGRRQKVRSLSYCEHAIDAAIERWRRALNEGLPGRRGLDDALSRLSARVRESAAGASFAAEIEALRADPTDRDANRASTIEASLRAIEDRCARALEQRAGASRTLEIRVASLEATSAYAHRMPADTYGRLVDECFRRRLLEEFRIPRLSLADGA